MGDRRDWLLLFLSPGVLGSGGADAVDPIRIQKGMFLLSQRGPARDLYGFEPYNWGPFSPEIYRDLEQLRREHLVERQPVPGGTWSRWRATPEGENEARRVAERLAPDDVTWLASARSFVTSRSFKRLLRDIYAEYPEYATQSRLR
jgi:hypothetical protein